MFFFFFFGKGFKPLFGFGVSHWKDFRPLPVVFLGNEVKAYLLIVKENTFLNGCHQDTISLRI